MALYSHDTLGLGHLRRNLAIATALTGLEPAPEVLLVAGAAELRAFALPTGSDALTLPGIAKDAHGAYAPRTLGGDLGQVLRLRADVLRAGLTAFAPDLLIVDKVAGGFAGELVPSLEALSRAGRTRVVLGLRDVLDDEATALAEWELSDATRLVSRHYDHVWVYGDPTVYDLLGACDLPSVVRERATFTGYLGRRGTPAADADVPTVVCTVGGGQDGASLARAFAAAELPPGRRGVLVAGPHLPAADLAHLDATAARREDLEVRGFVDDCADLIAAAESVVAMAGYNTTAEILAAGVPALLVPRIRPRREQEVRATRLAAHGVVDTCHPEAATPAHISAWLRGERRAPPRPRRPIDLDGLTRVRALAAAALRTAPPTSRLQETSDAIT